MNPLTLFDHVTFNEQYHTYSINGQRLTNVSKLVKSVTPAFDADYWSKRKATERGVDPSVILAEWDAKGKRSIELGNQVHAHIEAVLLNEDPFEGMDDPYLSLNQQYLPAQCAHFEAFWLSAQKMMTPVAVEYVLADEQLGYAGMADALMQSVEGDYHLWDWKTGSKFNTTNKFAKMLAPFDDLDDCEFNKYSLQVSMYRVAIQRAMEIDLGDSYIVYLSETGYTIHKALDLQHRVVEWLGNRPF